MDKFTAIQAFLRVVDAGSFSKAADLMNVPKSSVTRMIQMLEQDLRVKLLHRTTRQLTVTLEGASYYEGAVHLLAQMDELDSSVARATATPKGRVKIELPASVAFMIVIPALPEFTARYPDIQLELGVSNRSVDLISENIDCVIRVGAIINDSLIARYLGDLSMLTCAAPRYLKDRKRPSHPSDLETEHTLIRIVSPRTGRFAAPELVKGDERVTIGGAHRVSVNDSTAALVAGIAGLGVLTTYSFLVQQHLENGSLELVLPDWSSGSAQVHVAYPANRHLANKVRVFVEWVSELFGSHTRKRSHGHNVRRE
jgi:LysR family transcriptional regulator for bpeEF and oprC